VIALEHRAERKESRESYPLERMAEAALARYGLAGAKLENLPHAAGEEERAFAVSFPMGVASIHPYLGRLAGKRFTLRMLPPSEESRAAAVKWMKEIAACCRDTEEASAALMPEPVPACDGSLVTLIAVGGDVRHCLVYR
jgi:hypothetical protein